MMLSRDDRLFLYLSVYITSHLMLEALDGFIIVLGIDGHILYTRYRTLHGTVMWSGLVPL